MKIDINKLIKYKERLEHRLERNNERLQKLKELEGNKSLSNYGY